MKLFFIFPLSGPKNGVSVISNYILKDLKQKKNFDITVIDTSQASDFQNFGNFNFKKILKIFKILRKIFRIQKSDYVYLNFTPSGFAFYRDLIILLLSRFKTTKITIHIHANGLEERVSLFNKFLFKKINIIVINKDQKEKLNKLSLYPVILRNSLPDHFANVHTKKVFSDDLKLIFLSNISDKKGVDRIIKAAEILKDNNIKCEIDIYGGALTKMDLTKVQNLDLKYNFIKYNGPIVNDDDKFISLKKNDVLLFLSDNYYEVYPLVYIESLMSGLPIITTTQFVSKKLESLNVAFILEDDMSNFIEILNYNLLHKRELNERARKVYLDEYSFPKFINKIEQIIKHET